MTEPRTTLDARFSDPGASPTSWADTRAELDRAELFWLVSVRADGRPHMTPLVSVLLDDILYFTTGAAEQKYLNLQTNQHVILATGRNDWNQGLDIVVEGDAALVNDVAILTRLANLWATKWDGRWQYQVADGEFRHEGGGTAQVYAVAPAKVLAFGKGTFTHTSHRF